MIARIWHGVVAIENADTYYEFLQRSGIPDYKKTPGNLGVQVLRRIEGQEAHFLLTSFWESFEAIAKFAGDDLERAYYYPEDQDFLLEFEPFVSHHEILELTIAEPLQQFSKT
jgi:heme-degrading monooxygenase HmoA